MWAIIFNIYIYEFQTFNKNTTFKKSFTCGSDNAILGSDAYDDFAEEVLRLYNEVTDYREVIAKLIYVEIELIEAIHHQPDNRYLVKASRLVQKILGNIEFEFKHQNLTKNERRKKGDNIRSAYNWTADDAHFVELVYGLIESKSIENGNVKINEFADHLGAFFGLYIRDVHDAYSSTIKRRGSDGRTYFLRKMAYLLDMKMCREDDTPPPTPPAGYVKTLFDDM